MKIKIKVTLALLLAAQLGKAQNTFPANGSVGIGTIAPNSAAITEMVSTSKGLLIPRMTKNQRDAIASPVEGLMIYQTNSTPGFYYFSGNNWKAITPAPNSWSLTGNAGTSPLVNFIGTTDDRNLIFKVNNQRSGMIEQSVFHGNTSLGYETLLINNIDGDFNSAFGFQAMKNSFVGNSNAAFGFNSMLSNTEGDENAAFGEKSLLSNTKGDFNIAIGKNSLFSNTTGSSNVAVGHSALQNNISTNNLVAIGDSALFNQNAGSGKNTAIGSKALFANTNGNSNTATGFNAMRSNTTGVNNTANGESAMFSNIDGINNTAIGAGALFSNTNGNGNTAVGISAANANTTGNDNTAIGNHSFSNNTTGFKNTALGSETLANNSIGNYNTAVGEFALVFNTTGSNNIAVGASALENNNSANASIAIGTAALANSNISRQVAIGDSALYNLNGGSGFNTAVGARALFASTTAQENAAFGFGSLQRTTTGNFNAAFGTSSLTNNTSGASNTAVGTNAIGKGTAASNNTAVGTNALNNVTTGGNNTAIGRSTLTALTTGSSNTAIGYSANVSSANLTNATAIGNGAVATASNQVMLGDNAVTVVRTFGTIIVPSDGRFKKNVKENVPGLEFIRALRPVTYNYDVHGLDNMMKTAVRKEKTLDENMDAATETAMTAKEKKIYTGFIAQEVEKTTEKFKYEFNGLYKPQNENDPYGLGYAEFVVPLVKAVQELASKNDKLNDELNQQQQINSNLQQQIDELKNLVAAGTMQTGKTIASQQAELSNDVALLSQNIPNPFSNYTVIKYHLPQQVKQAVIKITSADGKIIKIISITAKGNGRVNLETGSLAAGTYHYTLVADGKVLETKSMVLIK